MQCETLLLLSVPVTNQGARVSSPSEHLVALQKLIMTRVYFISSEIYPEITRCSPFLVGFVGRK